MAYLGGTALGVSSLLGLPSLTPDYTGVVLHGGESFFNFLWIVDYELTDDEFLAIELDTIPTWDSHTILLATFENSDLSAGSITGISAPIQYYDFFRSEVGSTTLTKLASVPYPTSSYIDKTALPNKNYVYTIFAKNATEISTPIVGTITTTFYGMYLISIDTDTSYKFDFNLAYDGSSAVTAYARHDGYNKFSSYTYGDRNFIVGKCSAVLSPEACIINDELIQTAEFIRTMQNYIADKQEKYVKTRKGEIFKVRTFNFSSANMNVAIVQQPYYIAFDFEEVGEVHG